MKASAQEIQDLRTQADNLEREGKEKLREAQYRRNLAKRLEDDARRQS